MLPGRPDDKIAGTFLYSHISRDAAALDRDRIFFAGMPQPIRDYELNLALVYHAQIVPGWTIQPAFHYVFHPGGHIPDPNSPVPGAAIKDAAVFAVRSVIIY
jgi:porin